MYFNPDSNDFNEFIGGQGLTEAKLEDNLLAKEVATVMAEEFFPHERKDYKIFSIYEVKGLNIIANKEMTYLGAFGIFIPIDLN